MVRLGKPGRMVDLGRLLRIIPGHVFCPVSVGVHPDLHAVDPLAGSGCPVNFHAQGMIPTIFQPVGSSRRSGLLHIAGGTAGRIGRRATCTMDIIVQIRVRRAPIDDGHVIRVTGVGAAIGIFRIAFAGIGEKIDLHGQLWGMEPLSARSRTGIAQVFIPKSLGRTADGGVRSIRCGVYDGKGEAVAVIVGILARIVAGQGKVEIGAKPLAEGAASGQTLAVRAHAFGAGTVVTAIPDDARYGCIRAAELHPAAGVAPDVFAPQEHPVGFVHAGRRIGQILIEHQDAMRGVDAGRHGEVGDVVFEGDGREALATGGQQDIGFGGGTFAAASDTVDGCAAVGVRAGCGKGEGAVAYGIGAGFAWRPEVKPGQGQVIGALFSESGECGQCRDGRQRCYGDGQGGEQEKGGNDVNEGEARREVYRML